MTICCGVTSPLNIQADDGNLESLVKTEPACVSCHRTLDPLAATLYGFWQHDMHDVIELSIYHPEREWDGELDLDLQMAWYGTPLSAPAQLGEAIAADERFYSCSATISQRLWKTSV